MLWRFRLSLLFCCSLLTFKKHFQKFSVWLTLVQLPHTGCYFLCQKFHLVCFFIFSCFMYFFMIQPFALSLYSAIIISVISPWQVAVKRNTYSVWFIKHITEHNDWMKSFAQLVHLQTSCTAELWGRRGHIWLLLLFFTYSSLIAWLYLGYFLVYYMSVLLSDKVSFFIHLPHTALSVDWKTIAGKCHCSTL